MLPKFFVVNYARGSAGKFLISLLMSSNSFAHYDPTVETKKDKINYIKKSFISDMSNWLLHEPSDKLAWNINFVSNTYPRGNDLTVDEFNEMCKIHCTNWFHENVAKNKKIAIPWHKEILPSFLGNDVISIRIDRNSLKWYGKTVWAKHYGIVNGKIHIKENDPKYYQVKSTDVHKKFQNPIFVDQSIFSFARKNIFDSNERKFFSNKENLLKIGSKYVIDLSSILNLEKLETELKNIYQVFDIDPIEKSIVREGFNHWRSLHDF